MQVTGYKLMARLRELMNRREALYQRFAQCVEVFPSERERWPNPLDVSDELEQLERTIAELQTAQTLYNSLVRVTVGEEWMSLAQAVKTVGGMGRLAKLWKKVAVGGDRDRYRYNDSRSTDAEHKQPQVSQDEALDRTGLFEQIASQYREAIQMGNATSIHIEGIDHLFN